MSSHQHLYGHQGLITHSHGDASADHDHPNMGPMIVKATPTPPADLAKGTEPAKKKS